MKFSKLVEFVSKKPIPPHVKHLIVEVMVSDEEGEDVEVCLLISQLEGHTQSTRLAGAFHRCANLSRLRRTEV